MKIIRILAIGFFVIYALLAWYPNKYVSESSFNWLVAKLIFIVLAWTTSVVFHYNTRKESLSNTIVSICLAVIWTVYLSYQEITKYQRVICQDSFGLVFNSKRRQLGAPEIPADWHIVNRYSRSVNWNAKDSVGHYQKYISIDSTCSISLEDDDYNLKPVNGLERSVSITTKYAKGRGARDSLFYYYRSGDSTQHISRKQADSIFALEKIKKDY